MKVQYFYLFTLFLFSSNALPSPFDILGKELTTNIFTFLDPKDIKNAINTNNSFSDIGNKSSESGKFLREISIFHVTTQDNQALFLDEYLNAPRQAISSVDNLGLLLKGDPNKKFIKLILQSIPHVHETIKSDLKSLHQETFQIDNLISSLPAYKTSHQQLADILIGLGTWDQVRDQVWDQVRDQAWDQVRDQAWDQVSDQVWDQVSDQVGDQVRDQVWDQVSDQVSDQVGVQIKAQVRAQVWAQVRSQVRSQVGDQVRVQVNEELQHFQFASAFEANNLNEVLKLAIDYTFTVYQLGTIAMMHSEVFKNIHRIISQFIYQRISPEQASAIMSNINIPEADEDNYLVNSQLDMIKRHLLNAE